MMNTTWLSLCDMDAQREQASVIIKQVIGLQEHDGA